MGKAVPRREIVCIGNVSLEIKIDIATSDVQMGMSNCQTHREYLLSFIALCLVRLNDLTLFIDILVGLSMMDNVSLREIYGYVFTEHREVGMLLGLNLFSGYILLPDK